MMMYSYGLDLLFRNSKPRVRIIHGILDICRFPCIFNGQPNLNFLSCVFCKLPKHPSLSLNSQNSEVERYLLFIGYMKRQKYHPPLNYHLPFKLPCA